MIKPKILGLCGSQGTGKSSIINGVKDLGRPINQAQIARTAQKSLGWDSLTTVEKSVDNMHALQEAILAAMYDRDKEINESGVLTVVERTPADVWAYTKVWCNRLGIDATTDEWAIGYKNRCREMANAYNMFLFVPISNAVKFVAEVNRADLASREFVNDSIKDFIYSGGLPIVEITKTSIADRVDQANVIYMIQKIKG